jgi:ribosomal protein S18 acetylase RimI-like enzyme
VAVRLVRESEWELARDARLRALVESPAAFLSTFAEEEGLGADEWRERVHPGDRSAWFAESDGERFSGVIVVAFAEPDSGLASLFSMWVDPACRRRGIGRALYASSSKSTRRCTPPGHSTKPAASRLLGAGVCSRRIRAQWRCR